MRKIKSLFLVLLILCPLMVFAEEEKVNLSKYNTLNLTEVLGDEEIKPEYKEYSEGKDKINIYLFRGHGCGYCRAFLTFLNSITDEYGKYFNLVSFETWYDEENYNLMKNVSNFLGQEASGVPYIIIGEQVFPGYAESYDDKIKSAIETNYNAKDRYDVIDAYNDYIDEQERAKHAEGNRIIIWNLVITLVLVGGLFGYVIYSNNKVMKKLSEVNKKNPIEKAVDKITEKVKKKKN